MEERLVRIIHFSSPFTFASRFETSELLAGSASLWLIISRGVASVGGEKGKAENFLPTRSVLLQLSSVHFNFHQPRVLHGSAMLSPSLSPPLRPALIISHNNCSDSTVEWINTLSNAEFAGFG